MTTMTRSTLDRRAFLGGLAVAGGAAALGGCSSLAQAPSLAKWRPKIGLQLYTVRDKFPTDYAGTIKAVAGIGYKDVQSTLNYANLPLEEIKRILDANGVISPVTHINPPNGAQFEPMLDAYARLGHRWTTIRLDPPFPTPAVAGGEAKPETVESVKRTAAQLNAAGVITKKHGLKAIIHNHTEEFEPLADDPKRVPYDILIAETDPDLVALELDVGWASAAGADPLALFRQAPGRFEVWHVKDMADLKSLQGMTPLRRHRAAKIVGMGQGDIDYRPIFAQADRAGLQHFYLEQDTAPATGDSIAAAAASYRYMASILV